VIGTATVGGRAWRFRATCSDDGEVEHSEIEPLD
jgi:hypothetical protein